MSNPIYLDYNATTPIDPRVAEVMLPYLNEHFGNPPTCCQQASCGFAFHTDYVKHAQWDGYIYADFRTAMCLYLHIPKKVYINDILTGLQDRPGNGVRKDLTSQNLGK